MFTSVRQRVRCEEVGISAPAVLDFRGCLTMIGNTSCETRSALSWLEVFGMAKRVVNVALIGQKFMGKAHSNAYLKVTRFFDVPVEPVMHTIVGRNEQELRAFAKRWGWLNHSTNWKQVVTSPER